MKTKYFLSTKRRLYPWVYIFKNIDAVGYAFCVLDDAAKTFHKSSEIWFEEDMYHLNASPITYKQARKILGTKNLNKALAIVKGL